MSLKNPSSSPSVLVRMNGITKRFGHVTVLEDVSFNLLSGEVHILAGENGAGKSTLIKILAGVHAEYGGLVEVDGREVSFRSPLDANDHGIAVIHQELSLIGSMNVADNLFLGRLKTKSGFVSDRAQHAEAAKWLAQLGIDADTHAEVETLPVATQQLIEIAKALSQQAKIIVMDEPTSALNEPEVKRLFTLIEQLTQNGCGIVYISHKMEEIRQIADRITVLRDGKLVGTAVAEELPVPKLIQWMVGRETVKPHHRQPVEMGDDRLQVEHLSAAPPVGATGPRLENIALKVKRGEVVGIGGLEGSGASTLLLALFGAARDVSGSIQLDSKRLKATSPRQAIDAGVMLLPSDRRRTGLVLTMSIAANVTLAVLSRITRFGWRKKACERQIAERAAASLGIRAADLQLPVQTLSGGNQQKVAIAKCLETQPRLLLLDEPTRGIDIGAKREIYKLLDQWAAKGISILLITSELPELLTLSDRILVMHRGRITAELTREDATAERVLAAAMGTLEDEQG